VSCLALSSNNPVPEGFFNSTISIVGRESVPVVRADVAAGDLVTGPRPSRIEIRLFRETRSVLEYSFPMIAVGQMNQSLSGKTAIMRNDTIPTVVVNRLVSTV